MPQFNPNSRWLQPSLALSSLAILLIALVHYSGNAVPYYWRPRLLIDFALWSGLTLMAAGVLRSRAEHYAGSALVGGILIYLACGAGLGESASVILFLGSAWAWGRLAIRLLFPSASSPLALEAPLFLGLALNLALFGLLIHYPVNTRLLYLGLFLAPFLVGSRALFTDLQQLPRLIAARSADLARLPFWSLAGAALLIGYVSRFALFPTVAYDDNATHLRLWTELLFQKHYAFNVTHQIWAVAPFAVDLQHAVVSLVAGSDARTALNIAFLWLMLRQLWWLSGQILTDNRTRLLILTLFASTPMLANLLTSLQTELFLGLLAASGVRLILDTSPEAKGSSVALLAIAAMSCATKLPAVVLGFTLLLAHAGQGTAFRHAWRGARPAALVSAVLILSFVAFHSYAAAWSVTYNPLFPLYNGIFKSPYFPPVNFSDVRYVKGFDFGTYWLSFFRTSQFFESRDFVAGFQYLLLLPPALLLCLRQPRRTALGLLIPLLGFGLVMYSATQYWRYLFPIMPLASIVIACLFSGAPANGRSISRYVLSAFIAINFFFLPGVSWFFETPLRNRTQPRDAKV